MGVGGCRWPSLCRASHNVFTSNAFRNSAPSSASAADAATHFKMAQLVKIAPLREIGYSSFGMDPRKNVRLLCFVPSMQSGNSRWSGS